MTHDSCAESWAVHYVHSCMISIIPPPFSLPTPCRARRVCTLAPQKCLNSLICILTNSHHTIWHMPSQEKQRSSGLPDGNLIDCCACMWAPTHKGIHPCAHTHIDFTAQASGKTLKGISSYLWPIAHIHRVVLCVLQPIASLAIP